MKALSVAVSLLAVSLIASGPAAAKSPRHPASRSPREASARAPREAACCQAPAGAVVEIALAEAVSTKHQKTGDRFAITLAEPLVIDGRVLVRAGAPGIGEVIQATRPGMGGKPAKLVLAARYLEAQGRRIPLQGLQLAAGGKSNAMAAQAVGLSGIAFGPLGFIGLAVPGGNVTFASGTSATAELARALFLPSLGAAPPDAVDAAVALPQGDHDGRIVIPPAPNGKGQVVFFRAKTLLGTGLWFKVRENGVALGKLSNGAYFVRVTDPGVHTFTAATEPEAKDQLKLEVDPGQTYYVEGDVSKGVAIGVPDLSPSDQAAFDKASKSLKLSPPPEAKSAPPAANSATNAANP